MDIVTKSFAISSSTIRRGVVMNAPVRISPRGQEQRHLHRLDDLVEGIGQHALVDAPGGFDRRHDVAEPRAG
jgi:hypothetical protein